LAVLKEKVKAYDNSFENIVSLMIPAMKNNLKAKYYISKYSNEILNINSLDSISKILDKETESKFIKYSDVNIGNNNQEIAEPKVMAQIFSLSQNEISPIIEGKKGIYIVKSQSVINQPTVDENSIIEKSNNLQKEIRNQIEQDYYPALYNAYNVRDERARNMIINN